MNICAYALSFVLATFPHDFPGLLKFQNEIATRTVRLEIEGARCSGVLIDAHTVRTAGHCFRYGTQVRAILNMAGEELPGHFTAMFKIPLAFVNKGGQDDLAEIRSDRPLADVGPIDIVDVSEMEPLQEVWVGGYGNQAPLRLLWSYYLPHQVLTMLGPVTRHDAVNTRQVRVRPGDSGGPAWMLRDGKLALVGTVSADTEDRWGIASRTTLQRIPVSHRLGSK